MIHGAAQGADCPTGKVVFASRSAAAQSRGFHCNEGRRMRAYFCSRCHGWHLTTEVGTRVDAR